MTTAGPLTADATEPACNGYLLTVACPCGVVFGRWIIPEAAELDLLQLRLRDKPRHERRMARRPWLAEPSAAHA